MVALSARDFHGYLAGFTTDYVFRVDRSLTGSGDGDLVVPRRSLLNFLAEFFDTWDEVRYEFDSRAEVVNGRVFSHDRWVGRRRPGNPQTSTEFYAVATFRGDRVREVVIFADREDALDYARSDA